MSLNFKLLRNRNIFIGFIIFLVGVLTAINNYYFYEHVERSAKRDARQLKAMLESEIEFCRNNRISAVRYRKNIETLVQNFAYNAYYNDILILKHEKGSWEKDTIEWDKVVKSDIYIKLPKLKSENKLEYYSDIKFSSSLYFNSIIKSMTFSIFEMSEKILNSTSLTSEERKSYDYLSDKKEKFDDLKKEHSEEIDLYFKKKFLGELTQEDINSYNALKKDLLENQMSKKEIKEYWDLYNRESPNEISSKDLKTYWYRSRPAIGFTIFTIVLLWMFRRREFEVAEIIKQNEEPHIYSNKDIGKIIDVLRAKKYDNIETLTNIGININAKNNSGMTALMLYALENTSEKNKLNAINSLISNGANVNLKSNHGTSALMLYAIENKENDEDSKVIQTLIENSANVDEKNNAGMTSLMLCSSKDRLASVKILLKNGADINITQTVSAKELATSEDIKKTISRTQNSHPQELVKILSNFTHKPMKFTTHTWDFGSLGNAFGTFDEAMREVKSQFESINLELKELSPNLYKKISIFLFNTDPNLEESWCSKSFINIGWLSLKGLKEYCDDGKNAFDFQLKEPFIVDNKELNTFGEVINLFKQEIEMRVDFNNLEQIFSNEKKKLGRAFKLNLIESKLQRQFYTDTQSLGLAISKVFEEIKKRKNYSNIEVITRELEDRSLELKIIQVDSRVTKTSESLINETKNGDFSDIKNALNNLCDWSVESVCEDGSFRINYLHSNNIAELQHLDTAPKGFTHILRFYR